MSPNQAGVYTVSAIIICASTSAVILRFHARSIKGLPFKSDDYLVAFSMLLVWALAIILIVGAARGTLGTHTLQNPQTGAIIPTWHENDTSKLGGISQLILIIALGVLKLSVVMLYRRIFNGRKFRAISFVACIFIATWTVAFFFATVFECGRDLSLLWKSLTTYKHNCGDYKYILLSHAASDVFTDLVVLALPLPVIWLLDMTRDGQVALSFLFLLGLLSTAAGVARLVIVAEDIYETTTGARDVRGVETNTLIWSYVEVGVGVVAACFPTFKPIFNRRTPESIVHSVRSVISLGSLNSSERNGNLGSRLGTTEPRLKAHKNSTHGGSEPMSV